MTSPTIQELQNLDLAGLLELLAEHTSFYTNYIKEEGFSDESNAYRQAIDVIQAAIQLKKNLEQNATSTITNINFTQDDTQPLE